MPKSSRTMAQLVSIVRPFASFAASLTSRKDGPIVQPLWRASYQPFAKTLKGYHPHPTEYYFCQEMWMEVLTRQRRSARAAVFVW